jgi:hypothetical protein
MSEKLKEREREREREREKENYPFFTWIRRTEIDFLDNIRR